MDLSRRGRAPISIGSAGGVVQPSNETHTHASAHLRRGQRATNARRGRPMHGCLEIAGKSWFRARDFTRNPLRENLLAAVVRFNLREVQSIFKLDATATQAAGQLHTHAPECEANIGPSLEGKLLMTHAALVEQRELAMACLLKFKSAVEEQTLSPHFYPARQLLDQLAALEGELYGLQRRLDRSVVELSCQTVA